MSGHPFEPYIPRLRRYALALLHNRALADDLVQDTLERALRKFSLFRRDTDLRAWLFTVMHNVYVNDVRAAARRHADTADAIEPAVVVDDAVTLRDLLSSLARLAPEQREVVLLVGLEQLSYEETARVLNVPIGTIMSRLSRGRDRLRALMSGEASPYLRRIK
jgi:RNA polymerase sigma-70 factor (ECF subfamily)